MVYRRLAGINNFDRIIRFDSVDAIADTNEIRHREPLLHAPFD